MPNVHIFNEVITNFFCHERKPVFVMKKTFINEFNCYCKISVSFILRLTWWSRLVVL